MMELKTTKQIRLLKKMRDFISPMHINSLEVEIRAKELN